MELVSETAKCCKTAGTMQIKFKGLGERLPSGGPLAGRVILNGIQLDGIFGVSYKLSRDGTKILLQKIYILENRKFLSKISQNSYSVVVVDTEKSILYESVQKFPLFYIRRMEDDQIFINSPGNSCEQVLRFNEDAFEAQPLAEGFKA
ncbi:MAG: hypothetical protein ACM3UR_04900 [Bacteroidota bacterium]